MQTVNLSGKTLGPRFDGIGAVNGGGATAVLLKDYPATQRDQILDLVFKPKFGASISALFVEIPGDGNATQGSMPSHQHTRDDLNFGRGYLWWILREAKKRNPKLSLDGTVWSAPGWIGESGTVPGGDYGDAAFWSQDAADYYVTWLRGLREEYGLEFEAIGCRNEKGYSPAFAKLLRATLNRGGFADVKLHAFDHWPDHKFDWVEQLLGDAELREAVDILGAHVLERSPASKRVQEIAAQLGKPIWNTEEHVYKKGIECALGIVHAFNESFVRSGATKCVNWYDIGATYALQPYSQEPPMIWAHCPWSGHYVVREALWGYAHYGQFCEIGWHYLPDACGDLENGGTFVTLVSPDGDYSVIIETKGATQTQEVAFQICDLPQTEVCVWRSHAAAQFVQEEHLVPREGAFSLVVQPDSIYSLSTTRGQQKGSFDKVPAPAPFPFPYVEDFSGYENPADWGYLPRYTADIAGAFELVPRPDKTGFCLRQVVPVPTISWAPDWKPYTIIGDENWRDYEVSADVWLHEGETAGIMGRVNHVGTGYGFVPQGYVLQLRADGACELLVVRGKKKKQELVGDAEQQALLRAQNDASEGGEKVLASVQLATIAPQKWHNLKLRFEGANIAAFVDDQPVLRASDALYSGGVAGLLAGQDETKLSTPYFDNLRIQNAGDSSQPAPTSDFSPIYASPLPLRFFRNLRAGQPQTVVVYGTSLSATSAWPRALKEYFDRNFPGLVNFHNAAQSGQHSNWGLSQLEKRVLAHAPDLVFIENSMNDAATKHGISTDKSRENLNQIIESLRAQNSDVEIVLQTMNVCWDAPDEPQGKKSASERPHLADYYALYRRTARQCGLPLVDNAATWLQLQREQREQFERWLPDGCHPIDEASHAITWKAIESLLESARLVA